MKTKYIKFIHLSIFIAIYINFLILFYRFINARRRIVQPMIDQSNRAGEFFFYYKLFNQIQTSYFDLILKKDFEKKNSNLAPFFFFQI